MVKIRLSLTGKKHQRSYRIVVIEEAKKRDGKNLEVLGFYNPQTKPETLKIDQKRLEWWLEHGAQPSPSLRKVLKEKNNESLA